MSRPWLPWITVLSLLCVLLTPQPSSLEAQVGPTVYEFETSSSGPFIDATTLSLPPGGYRIRAEVGASGGSSFGCGGGGADAVLTFSLESLGSAPIAERGDRYVETDESGGTFCGNFGVDANDQLGPWSVSFPLSALTGVSQDSDVGSAFSGTLAGSAGESVPSCGTSTSADTWAWSTYEADFTLLATTTLGLDLSGSIGISVFPPGGSCPGSALVMLTVVELVTPFVRGDANSDGSLDVADPVASLAYQFSSGTAFCLEAHDVNDDGAIDIGDPVYALTHLFAGGPPPPAPFPSCGLDPSPTSLGCAQFDACP